jgi:hypothetical protein
MTKERIDYISKESKDHSGKKNAALEEIWKKIKK